MNIESYLRMVEDPADYFLNEWPMHDHAPVKNPSQEVMDMDVIDSWIDSLHRWAKVWGDHRLEIHSGEAFEAAQYDWGVSRPDLFGAIEIGRESIFRGLASTMRRERDDQWVQVYKHVAEPFADSWAVTNDREIAALILGARLDRTEVTAFALAKLNREFSNWIQITGEVRFHIVGDPQSEDLSTFMRHSQEWAKTVAGMAIRRTGGQAATFPTVEILRGAFNEYQNRMERSGRSTTQLEFAAEYGMTDRGLRAVLERLGIRWRDLVSGS